MARIPVEIGQLFHKTDSLGVVWTVDSFNEFTEPMHARLTRLDDPTTHITVSIDVLSDPRYWSATDMSRPYSSISLSILSLPRRVQWPHRTSSIWKRLLTSSSDSEPLTMFPIPWRRAYFCLCPFH